MYSQLISFLHTGIMQVAEIIPRVRQDLLYIINIMVVDVLATQGARASVTLIFTMLNPNNSVPVRQGQADLLVIQNVTHINIRR